VEVWLGWREDLRNFWGEAVWAVKGLGSKKCAIPRGSWLRVSGGLATKTVQFLEGADSGLWDAWQQKLHNS